MARLIRYLNTDLDLASEERPTDLVAGLRSGGTHTLHRATRGADGLWHVTLETDESYEEPEETIGRLLDAIEALSEWRRRAWRACKLREFNIGYDSGFKPWAFNSGLSSHVLRRMAKACVTLRITIYPPEPGGREADTRVGSRKK